MSAALPQFLLAHDEDDEQSETFLIHTQEPRFIARVDPETDSLEPVITVLWWENDGAMARREELVPLMKQASAYIRRALDD